MKTTRFTFFLLLVFALNLGWLPGAGGTDQVLTKWNAQALSPILDKTALKGLGEEAFPAWKVKQATWPSEAEIRSARVQPDAAITAECVLWLKKYINAEYLPQDVDQHLLALGRWGAFRKESEQTRLCDVFLVRFTKGPYVIQVQESSYNVVISVADERLAGRPDADHQGFVSQVATAVLNAKLVADPNVDLHRVGPKRTEAGTAITTFLWFPPAAVTTDSKGRKALVGAVAENIGADHIDADTDGRLIRFDIRKFSAGSGSSGDPYQERFGPKSVGETEPSRK